MLRPLMNNGSAASDMQRLKRAKRTGPVQSGVLLGVLLALSVSSHAQQSVVDDGKQWSQWQVMDKGFIARKKVPPRMNLAPQDRALASVKSQTSRLLRKRTVLRNDMQTTGQQNRKAAQSQLNAVDAQISLVQAHSSMSIGVPRDGVWLYNSAGGLHTVSVADLAVALGYSEAVVAEQLQTNQFSLTNNGQAVSYHYDKAAAQVLYVAELYETIYTDENAYRARLSASAGGRFPAFDIPESATQAVTVLEGTTSYFDSGAGLATAFRDTLHYEEEPDLHYNIGATRADPDADYWFWDYLFGSYKDSISIALNAPDPAATGSAQLRIVMRGWTDLYAGDEHQVIAELNGQVVGAALIWDAYNEATLVADFDQSILDASGNNSLLIRSIYPDGKTPGELLDKIELDYMRLPVAQNGQLWLHQAAQGRQRVSGFSSDDIVVIEDPTGVSVLRKDLTFTSEGGVTSVAFQATEGVDYVVAEQGEAAVPYMVVAEAATLGDVANMGDYLIIAPRDFLGTEQALTRLREMQFSHVKTVWLDQIYAEYSAGRVDPFAIGRFMQDISATWSVTPTHVVILGNGSLDHKNRMGYDDSFVPPMLTATHFAAPWTLAGSDDRLLGANGDAAFAIGRIPIVSDAEGMAYVEKLSRYTQAAPDSSSTRAVLVADNPDSAGQFHANSDILSDWMLESLGFTDTTKLYHTPTSTVRSTFIDSATWDSHGYLTYDGHGATTSLGNSNENFINAADARALSNSQYPLFTALTCAAGDYAGPGTRSLAAELVLNPTGGAIAAMAPTGLSLDADAQFIGYIYAGTLLGSTKSTVGEALQRAKLLSAGEVNDFMTRIYSVVGDPAVTAR
jgi:hypothetical protein